MTAKPITWPIFPALLAAVAGSGAALLARGVPAPLVTLGLLAASVAALLLLERIFPLHASWNHGPIGTDVGLLLVNRLVDIAGIVAGTQLAVLFARLWPDALVTHLWPTGWPLVLQAFLGLVVGEVGRYAIHRASHHPGILWRLHRVHHEPERMYTLNGPRLHPLNQLWVTAAGPVVMLLLGAGLPAVVLTANLLAFLVLFQHANADLRFDGYNRLFMTADVHRWHHVRGRAVNFAIGLSVFDAIFGTLHVPARPPAAGEVGLAASP